MGLADLKWMRGAAASRNGDGSDGEVERDLSKADPALIGRALLDLVALVVAELKRRDEVHLSEPNESAAAVRSRNGTVSTMAASCEPDKETKEPEGSK